MKVMCERDVLLMTYRVFRKNILMVLFGLKSQDSVQYPNRL